MIDHIEDRMELKALVDFDTSVSRIVVVLPPRRRSLLPFRGEAVSGAKVLHFYETAVIQFTGIDAQLAELALNQSS